MRRRKGFTLVELLVVVAVLVILTTVAYPLYTQQVLKSRRTEARVALTEIALAEQRYFTVNGSYGTAAELGTAYTDALAKMSDGDNNGIPDYYAVALVSDASSFSATATAIGQQLKDTGCTSLTLDQLGVQSATGATPDKCW